jgi:hypothetical protein
MEGLEKNEIPEENSEETQAIEEEEKTGIELSDAQSLEQPETDDEETETVVMIGDEEPEPKEEAPQWVKDLRVKNRELTKENKRLKQQKESESAQKINAPGEKPKLEDFDFDPDKFERALNEWVDKKNKYENDLLTQENQKKDEEAKFQEKVKAYQKQKSELVFDPAEVEEAEQIVHDLMSVNQIGSIVTYANNPALVLVALGKNPKKAKELSSINDPVKFAIAMAEVEGKLKVTQRKPATKPERTVTGSGPVLTAGDKELERLRAEADKTDDMSKVVAYRRKMKQSKQA